MVAAYEATGIGPWALFCGKMIFAASDGVAVDDVESGSDQLRKFLVMLRKSGTEGKYMLAMYRIGDDQEIDSKTPVTRAFMFCLWEHGAEGSNSMNFQGNQQMSERMDRLEALLTADLEEEGEGKKKGGIGGMLNGLLELPQVQAMIGNLAVGLMSKVIPMNTVPQAAKIAGLEGQAAPAADSVLTPDQVTKVQQALNILCASDPSFGDHLMKIAMIAKNEPGKYKMFAAML